MSEHTPGPWRTVPPGHGQPTEYLCVQLGTDDMYTTLELLPADAQLIAAAPDLLALAKQYASECGECDGTGCDAVGHVGECEACADIRAVIAKAEGSAQQPHEHEWIDISTFQDRADGFTRSVCRCGDERKERV